MNERENVEVVTRLFAVIERCAREMPCLIAYRKPNNLEKRSALFADRYQLSELDSVKLKM